MLTLNQIVSLLQNFQESHLQLAEFFEGDIYDYDVSKTGRYPVMTCVLQPSSLAEAEESFNFQIGIWNKVNLGDSNRRKVLSDTRLICKDVVAYLKSDVDINEVAKIDFPITLENHTEQFSDRVAGHFMNVNIKQWIDLNACQIPLNDDAITTEDNFDIETEAQEILITE